MQQKIWLNFIMKKKMVLVLKLRCMCIYKVFVLLKTNIHFHANDRQFYNYIPSKKNK